MAPGGTLRFQAGGGDDASMRSHGGS